MFGNNCFDLKKETATVYFFPENQNQMQNPNTNIVFF